MFNFIIKYFDNKKELERIKKWQADPGIHSFTCSNDSRHEPLKGVIENGNVILECCDCDYTQILPWYYYEIAHRLNP